MKSIHHKEGEMRNYQDLARCRSNLYALLSSVYLQIPQKEIFSLNWDVVAPIFGAPQKGAEKSFQEMEKGLKLIRNSMSLKNQSMDERMNGLLKDWTRLFRGVDLKGPLPPYESLYRTGKLQDKPAQEINRLFSAMGIRIPEEWHQPSDYIGVELDFMRLLCSKEEEAWKKNHLYFIHEISEIEKSFLENHLILWIPLFCIEMTQKAREDFFKGIGQLTEGFVRYDRIWVTTLFSITQGEER